MNKAGEHPGTLLTARPVMNLDGESKCVHIVTNTKSYRKCFIHSSQIYFIIKMQRLKTEKHILMCVVTCL
jgi:hypothetical protein